MNFFKRMFATPAPGPLGQPSSSSLEQVLTDLWSRSLAVRSSALVSILMFDESAVEPLLKQVQIGKNVSAAAKALEILGNRRAVVPLCEIIKNKIIKNEQSAFDFGSIARALGRLADERAVDTLIHLLDNFVALAPKNDPTRHNPDRAWTVLLHATAVRRPLAEALGALRDSRAVPTLIRALDDDHFVVRVAVAEALTNFGEPAVDAFIASLDDMAENQRFAWDKRASLERALESCKFSEKEIDRLLGIVEDSSTSEDARRQCVNILGQSGNKRAVPPMIEVLRREHGSVQLAAASALGKLGDSRAVEALIATLNGADVVLLTNCYDALGVLCDDRAVGPLCSALSYIDSDVCRSAAFALARFQDSRAFDSLVHCLTESKDEYPRSRAAESLGKLGDSRAIDPLLKALSDEEESIRKNAIMALGKLDGFRFIDTIAKCLNDKKLEVQLAAAETLAELGDARGFDLMLVTLLTDDLEHRVLQAIRGLSALDDLKAVGPLVVRMRGSTGKVRKAIIAAVAKFGAPANPAIQRLLGDPRPLVRIVAQTVLDQMSL